MPLDDRFQGGERLPKKSNIAAVLKVFSAEESAVVEGCDEMYPYVLIFLDSPGWL
jgi:hypothetical protein